MRLMSPSLPLCRMPKLSYGYFFYAPRFPFAISEQSGSERSIGGRFGLLDDDWCFRRGVDPLGHLVLPYSSPRRRSRPSTPPSSPKPHHPRTSRSNLDAWRPRTSRSSVDTWHHLHGQRIHAAPRSNWREKNWLRKAAFKTRFTSEHGLNIALNMSS